MIYGESTDSREITTTTIRVKLWKACSLIAKIVMVRTPYSTGSVITFEPIFLGSQKLLIKVKMS